MPVIDKATFEELKQMSGADFINELIDAFLEDAPNMIQSMQTALAGEDVEIVSQECPLAEIQCQYVWSDGTWRACQGIGNDGQGK